MHYMIILLVMYHLDQVMTLAAMTIAIQDLIIIHH